MNPHTLNQYPFGQKINPTSHLLFNFQLQLMAIVCQLHPTMIEFAPLIFLMLSIAISSLAGIGLASLFYGKNGVAANVCLSSGLLFGPFLIGLGTIVILKLLPGAAVVSHVATVVCILLFVVLVRANSIRVIVKTVFSKMALKPNSYILAILVFVWFALLLTQSVVIPLTANDSLEYAMVARELFLNSRLDVYPLIDTNSSSSGFFAPWTHPPLYPALMYFAYALQGTADTPGLIRLIAPWFTIVSAIGIYSVAFRKGKNNGLWAVFLFISTPLLYLNVGQGQIDALPIAGICLLIVVMSGLNGPNLRAYVLVGVSLGIGLWTHSQAILFFSYVASCLVVVFGLLNWKKALLAYAFISIIAVFIGFQPYYHNYEIFGAVISDNPAVFSLPSLQWPIYFEYSRGLNTSNALIQYGVLKGWFSFASFGVLFWISSIAILHGLTRSRQNHLKELVLIGTGELPYERRANLISATIFATFMLGVLASVALGIDLMVKNDRYWLLLSAPLAIISCGTVARLFEKLAEHYIKFRESGRIASQDLILSTTFAIAAALLIGSYSLGWNYRYKSVPSPTITSYVGVKPVFQDRLQNYKSSLLWWPSIDATLSLNDFPNSSGLILSTRPADMYYSNRRMLSYLDPALLDFYRSSTKEDAVHILSLLRISHVILTSYSIPIFQNSMLMSILADPSLTTLVFSNGMDQVYKMSDSGKRASTSKEFGPSDIRPWTESTESRIGASVFLRALGITKPTLFTGGVSSSSFSFFHRDYSTMVATGIGRFPDSGNKGAQIATRPNEEFVVNFLLKGSGQVKLWLAQYDATGRLVEQDSVNRSSPLTFGDLSLVNESDVYAFSRRVRTSPNTHSLRFAIERIGASSLEVISAQILEIK